MLENAVEADVGRYNGSGSASVILYTCRLALRIESYARYVLSKDAEKVCPIFQVALIPSRPASLATALLTTDYPLRYPLLTTDH